MRIVVNDIAAEYGGALTVLKSFYEYILYNDTENEYIFLLSRPLLEETERIKIVICDNVKKSGLHKMKFDFFSGKKLINSLDPDYVLSLQNIITFGVKARQGVYVHQSIPFQKEKNFSFLKGAERGTAFVQKFIGRIIKKSVKKADDVFVQTKWMKENVAEMCKVSPDKVSVVPFESDIPKDLEKAHSYPNNEFFYPATFEGIYKNHECIYHATDILSEEGISDYHFSLTLPKEDQPKRELITHCGLVDKQTLFEMYQNSVVVFPSYIETIGLPLIEARESNSLLLVADCQYSRETLNGYTNAYFFDPFKPKELADLMKKVFVRKLDFYTQEQTETVNNGWKVITDRIVR